MHPPSPAIPPPGAAASHGQTELLAGGTTATHWFTETGGVSWHVVTTGHHDHTPVLHIPGLGESWSQWHHQLSGLSDRFACLAVDLEGHETDCARSLPDLLDALGVEQVAVVANDQGTLIADQLCASSEMAQRVTAYVRVGPSPEDPKGPLTMPVLFLFPATDPARQVEDRTVTDAVPNGFLQHIDGERSLHLEAPTEVSSAIAAFLEAK